MSAAAKIGEFVTASKTNTPKALDPLVTIAAKMIANESSPDPGALAGVWVAALHTEHKAQRAPFLYILRQHGSKIPHAIDDLFERYKREKTPDAKSVENLIVFLRYAPTDQLRVYDDVIISLMEQYATSIFPVYAKEMLARLGDLGDQALPILQKHANFHSSGDEMLVAGALSGLCKIGPSAIDSTYNLAVAAISAIPDNRWHNLFSHMLHAAMTLISRGNKMNQFLSDLPEADFSERSNKEISRWLTLNKKRIGSDQC